MEQIVSMHKNEEPVMEGLLGNVKVAEVSIDELNLIAFYLAKDSMPLEKF